jgi:mRNA interferase MazF
MVDFPKRGDVYWAFLEPTVGSEIGKTRPVVIVQNDVGNRVSPVTIVVPVTSKLKQARPYHVELPNGVLSRPGIVLCNHIRALDKRRLREGPIARLDDVTMTLVDDALRVSLGLY